MQHGQDSRNQMLAEVCARAHSFAPVSACTSIAPLRATQALAQPIVDCAVRIAGRYAECTVRNPRLERVLAIPRDDSTAQFLQQISQFVLAPRVTLSLAAPARQLIERYTQHERRAVIEKHEQTLRVDRLIERLMTRVERIDAVRGEMIDAPARRDPGGPAPAKVPATFAQPPRATGPRVVQRVLRQTESRTAARSEPTAPPRPSAPEALVWPAPPAPPPSREARVPAVDVEQLADRVVRVIDRRLTATRERLGRF